MAVSKVQKTEILAALEQGFKDATSVAFVKNNGLSVEESTTIRRDLRESDAKIFVAKKTLISIAFKNVFGKELSSDILDGPITVLMSYDDAIAGMGKVHTHMKELNDKKVTKLEFT